MKLRNLHGTLTILTAFLIFISGASGVYAQGKGRGGDKHGGENRGGGQKERGGPPNQGNQDRGQEQRQQQRVERPQTQGGQGGKSQRYIGPPVLERPQSQNPRGQDRSKDRGRQNQDWHNRGQIQIEQPRQRGGERPQIRANERRQDRTWLPDQRVDQERIRRGHGIGDDRGIFSGRQRPAPLNNAWPNNYGYDRSREVHARNAERKAWKNEQKALSRDDRRFDRDFDDHRDNRQNQRVYQNRDGWRDNFLRRVIVNVQSPSPVYYDNYYPQYQPTYYGNYQPDYYGGNYYDPYPRYPTFRSASYYDPNSNLGGYYAPQYAGDPYYTDNYYDNFDVGGLTNSSSIGNFVKQLFGQLLAVGYDQGFNDGLAARSSGRGNRYFDDPYVYQNDIYDPYSASLGDNRRCLSEGYELGYADALDGQSQYDGYQYGDVDLVSVLIGNTLQML